MTPDDFATLLRRTMGLDAASVTPALIERAVAGRQKARGVEGESYWRLILSSEEELQELIEAVIVPETWFFRDREAFALLARLAGEEWPRAHGGVRPSRLLSLPCSSGEEPYSMAMALLDAGIPTERFQIDAVDISRRALAAAREGTYGRNSFRGDDLGFRDRHFVPAGREWRLDARARDAVRFQEGNLFSPAFLLGAGPYDALFCRNVLIYFDREAQFRVLEILERLLSPQGVLFVGPSETSLASEFGFAPSRVPQAFAFRKAGTASPAREKKAPPPSPAFVPPRKSPARPLPFPAAVKPAPKPEADVPIDDTLAGARLLADQGRLAEAATLCEAHLRRNGASAEAYYLMGVVCDAQRQHREAAVLYRKALYLEPGNLDVLAHLASLLESQGDAPGARVLNERARRLAAKQGA